MTTRPTMIASSSATVASLLVQARRAAATTATLLVTGETGTGKELLARALHAASPRAAGPFVAVNCAALPAQLFESELFGHRRGAFTGADSDKKGLFEIADGGTLFLDEIGELPLDMQAKLLRVLQERKVRPVGGGAERQVDVRVIAATHRDLEARVSAGSFRQDLYYRVNVFQLHLPPLRERREDVPALAAHFLKRFAAEYRVELPGFTQDALDALSAYNWPGNIRELENEVHRLVIVADQSRQIRAVDLSARVLGEGAAAA